MNAAHSHRYRIAAYVDARRQAGWVYSLESFAAGFVKGQPDDLRTREMHDAACDVIAEILPTSINQIGTRVVHGVSARICHTRKERHVSQHP
jgi:hypothetical protein